MKKTTKRGFTIVELVIVIAVIAILAAVLIPTFSGVISDAKDSSFRQAARNAYIQYVADDSEAAGGDFLYVDGDKIAAINNGNFELDDDDQIKIFTDVATALAALDLETAETGKEWTIADDAEGIVAPAETPIPAQGGTGE